MTTEPYDHKSLSTPHTTNAQAVWEDGQDPAEALEPDGGHQYAGESETYEDATLADVRHTPPSWTNYTDGCNL